MLGRRSERKAASLPFVPTDWVFYWMPYICCDRVRFMWRFNQISFMMGFGFLYFWCHKPFAGDHYAHFYESPLYTWVKNDLAKTGQLEENVHIKVKNFYPQE